MKRFDARYRHHFCISFFCVCILWCSLNYIFNVIISLILIFFLSLTRLILFIWKCMHAQKRLNRKGKKRRKTHETRKASFDTFEAYFCQRDDDFRLGFLLISFFLFIFFFFILIHLLLQSCFVYYSLLFALNLTTRKPFKTSWMSRHWSTTPFRYKRNKWTKDLLILFIRIAEMKFDPFKNNENETQFPVRFSIVVWKRKKK